MKFIILELERQKILNSYKNINLRNILTEDFVTTAEAKLMPTIGTYNIGKTTQAIVSLPKNSKLVKDGKKINITPPEGLVTWTYYCGSNPKIFVMNSPFKMYNGAYYSEFLAYLTPWLEENLCKEVKQEVKQEKETKQEVNTPPQKTAKEISDEQCALDCNQRWPYYSVVCDGGDWKKTLNSWISEKGGGKDKTTYRALRTSWCSGWRPGQTQENLKDFITPIFPGSETTTTTIQTQNQETSVY